MNIRRRLLGLALLTALMAVGVPALSSAQGGPCSPSTPQYCPPPNVKTGPAKHVTQTSATLTGKVNPNGSATSCYFEYGTTKHYGSTTPAQNVGSGTKSQNVSATVAGLMPKTKYHYQLVCHNLGGTAFGGDRTFTTKSAHKPPTVNTGKAKHVGSNAATLHGSVNPHGSATSCYFEYGTTKHYGSTTPAQNVGSGTKSQNVSARVTGLMPKTKYHYQLVCHNLGGTASGADKTFTTKKAHKPHKAPTVKTIRAKHAGSNAATLRGRVNPHGSATTCHFNYGTTKRYGSKTPVKHVGSGTKSKTVTARIKHLAPKTIYHFRLVCSNAAGRRRGRDRKVETKNKIRFRGSRTIHVSKRGTVIVRLHCSGNHRCIGFLTLTGKGGKRLAPVKRYVVAAHTTARIKLHLKSRVLARLKRKHHLSGTLHANDLDGSSATRRVKLRSPHS